MFLTQLWLNLRRYFDFGSIANKMCPITPLSNNSKQFIQIFSPGSYYAPFVGYGTNVKIPSEIKLPLISWEYFFNLAYFQAARQLCSLISP